MSELYERGYDILRSPHISEKANRIGEQSNQYVFVVCVNAKKPEIKACIEKLFDVRVNSVCTVMMKGKTKKTRHGVGRRSNWKKAYISVEQGQELDFVSTE